MLLKYQNVEDDAVAASVFSSRHSPYARRLRIIAGMILPGFFLILILSQALYSHDWVSAIVGVVIVGGLSVWILAGASRRLGRIERKLFREGKNKAFLGVHELEINDYGIFTKSEYGEGKIAWAAIDRIGSTPDYTFIFTGTNKAIPLPKSRILQGDYDAFVAELTSRFEKFASTASALSDNVKATTIVDYKPVSCEDKRAERHSGYGIAAFVIALVSMGVLFLSFVAAVIISIVAGESFSKDNPLFIMFVMGFLLAWGTAFVGAGLGIAGVVSTNRKKVFAIVGLILNLLIVFSVVLMIVLVGFRS